jgi:PAS domain S-box-containing protein
MASGRASSPPADATQPSPQPGVRQQLALIAAVGALSVLVGLIPFPKHSISEVCAAGILFGAIVVAALVVPSTRLPRWSWLLAPLGYIAVIAVLRDAQGGAYSGMGIVLVVPLIWIAYNGNRIEALIGLAAVWVVLLVPVWLVGAPRYPGSSWRGVVELVCCAALITFVVLDLADRQRAHAHDLAAQTKLARQSALQAEWARRQLASVVAAATQIAVIGIDDTSTVFFFSTGAENLLGYTADEVVGKRSGYELLDLHDSDASAMVAGAADRKPTLGTEFTWTCRRQDGRPVRLAGTFSPLMAETEDGESKGVVLVASDVTRREQLEAERERTLAVQREVTQTLVEQNQQLAELARMKDALVANVSHELRTPLTSIQGFVELLLDTDGAPLDEEQVRMLRAIERNAKQLLHVSDDLLTSPGGGRELRVDFVRVDLSVLAREAVDAIEATARDRGISITVECSGQTVVHGDPLRLHQLLGNLLTNAVKFTPAGGRVLVRVDAIGPNVLLGVHDTGQGIPKGERDHLFERFFRLASTSAQGIPGSGLGLAIAKSVVEAHSGTVDIIDLPGWSTTFVVRLPAVHTTAPPAAPAPPPGPTLGEPTTGNGNGYGNGNGNGNGARIAAAPAPARSEQ